MMMGSKASIQLLNIAICTITGCLASSYLSRHAVVSVSCHTYKSPTSGQSGRLRLKPRTRSGCGDIIDVTFLTHLRGGQQQPQNPSTNNNNSNNNNDDDNPGSYHGNYVYPVGTEYTAPTPDVVSTMNSPADIISIPSPSIIDTTTVLPASTPSAPTPSVLAIATSTNSKLSNLQERTGPAILMLGAISLLLKYTGKYGLIALVLVMQATMYAESTSIVEEYYTREKTVDTNNYSVNTRREANEFDPFTLQKWWWFATAVMVTSGRKLLSQYNFITLNQWNLITLGMIAISLVGSVVHFAFIASENAEEMYRNLLGKIACCHFSLLFLVGMSSFWIQTVDNYGIAWVLFPALLVIVNDTMAYVFGVLLGKHKLLPRLSPKKTVEGFVGAGISTFAVAIPLARCCIMGDTTKSSSTSSTTGRHALIMAVYVSLISPFGGFLASAVKRAHGAKDFGSLIPGHGGVVDRFDCQVVTAPFVYLYLKSCAEYNGSSQ